MGTLADEIAAQITDRTPRGIAGTVSRLITDGTLSVGDRLPTVRVLARELGVSPTTVSDAWQSLAAVGSIRTQGRAGSFVLGAPAIATPRRFRALTQSSASFALDLSTGTPDPDLLPDLGPALARVSRQNLTTSYLDDPVVAPLAEVLHDQWPFAAEAFTVVDGAMDALDRLVGVTVRLGDRVLVENPAFAPLLDLLEQSGAEVIGLELDDEGVTPESLRAGLAHQPRAVFLQPRAQNPSGVSLTAARASALAALLAPHENVVIIEDDHAGDISSAPLVSLGHWWPARTVLIRSYSKSHGPDLRLASVGGAGDLIRAVAARRVLGPGWSSRILQLVLVELLTSEVAHRSVAHACDAYTERRARICRALGDRGVRYSGSDGINLWVEVGDEGAAQITLAASGVRAAPGSPFLVDPLATDHLRVTTSRLRDGVEALADAIALAALGPAAKGASWDNGTRVRW